MDKFLVEVTSPAANLTYDMFIPYNMQIGEAVHLMAIIFSQLSDGTYTNSGTNILCEKETGATYDPNIFIKDTNIRNGAKLLLF